MIGEMRDVRTQLLIVMGLLLAADIGAGVMLLSPAGRSRAARQQEYERLRVERQDKSVAAAPARDIDKKLEEARLQEASFDQDRLVHRYSTISEDISRIAKENGVSVATVKYDETSNNKSLPAGYTAIGISLIIHGGYEQNMRFVNAIERQRLLLIVDGVGFGGMTGDVLTMTLHLSTYMRTQP